MNPLAIALVIIVTGTGSGQTPMLLEVSMSDMESCSVAGAKIIRELKGAKHWYTEFTYHCVSRY